MGEKNTETGIGNEHTPGRKANSQAKINPRNQNLEVKLGCEEASWWGAMKKRACVLAQGMGEKCYCSQF